jgi:predicted alpha/beta superfamily hydrolase
MVHTETIHSEYLDGERELYIFLPPGYDENPDSSYPVLYMQDGQNIFSAQGEGAMRWNVDETAMQLIEEGTIEEIIIVGISNSEWRDDEYTPTFDEKEGTGGYADNYMHFLIDELKAHIDSTYRVRPFREDTAIAGSSLGGLLSLYASMKYPEFFGKIAAFSPSLWWDHHAIMDLAKSWELNPDIRLWLDMGFNEGDDEDEDESSPDETAEEADDEEDDEDEEGDEASGDSDDAIDDDDEDHDDDDDDDDEEEDDGDEADSDDVDDDEDEDAEEDVDPIEESRAFCAILREKGFKDGHNLQYFEDPWGSHDEISWGNRIGMALEYLFDAGE